MSLFPQILHNYCDLNGAAFRAHQQHAPCSKQPATRNEQLATRNMCKQSSCINCSSDSIPTWLPAKWLATPLRHQLSIIMRFAFTHFKAWFCGSQQRGKQRNLHISFADIFSFVFWVWTCRLVASLGIDLCRYLIDVCWLANHFAVVALMMAN